MSTFFYSFHKKGKVLFLTHPLTSPGHMTYFDQWDVSKCDTRHSDLKSTCALGLTGLLSAERHHNVNEPKLVPWKMPDHISANQPPASSWPSSQLQTRKWTTAKISWAWPRAAEPPSWTQPNCWPADFWAKYMVAVWKHNFGTVCQATKSNW